MTPPLHRDRHVRAPARVERPAKLAYGTNGPLPIASALASGPIRTVDGQRSDAQALKASSTALAGGEGSNAESSQLTLYVRSVL